MEGNKGNTVLLTVIGVATLLVALVGATFAYFTANANNDNAESIKIVTGSGATIVYTGSQVSVSGIMPGYSSQGSFTVEYTASSDTAANLDYLYTLNYIVDENKLLEDNDGATGQLYYQITATNNKSGNDVRVDTNWTTAATVGTGDADSIPAGRDITGLAKSSSTNIVKNQVIKAGEKHTYTTLFSFDETGVSQDSFANKNYQAHIEISGVTSVAA